MRYTSTRQDSDTGFAEVVASSLGAGGGLYLPQCWPRLDDAALSRLAEGDHMDAVATLGALFSGEEIAPARWHRIAAEAFFGFRHPAIAPLSEIGARRWMLELFHGPTLSFKDYGLQPLARLLGEVASRESRPLFILGATSGDTGSAGIAAFSGRPDTRIVILHPEGRVSEVQRRQMTTLAADNVRNIAVAGSFDDCQRIAKALLAERAAANREAVLSVNSINWGRLLFQSAYYVHQSARLARLGRPVAFAVPSGNFGNALAAVIAARIGAPIAHLVVATNANDTLARVLTEGEIAADGAPVRETLSPAMDIRFPSNLERLVHIVSGGDAAQTAEAMESLRTHGRLAMPDGWRGRLPLTIEAGSADDEEVIATIAATYARTDRIVDPHTAVALAVAARSERLHGMETVVVSTAHPAKFPDAVERALGFPPPVPAPLSGLFDRPEHLLRCAPDTDAVRTAIEW